MKRVVKQKINLSFKDRYFSNMYPMYVFIGLFIFANIFRTPTFFINLTLIAFIFMILIYFYIRSYNYITEIYIIDDKLVIQYFKGCKKKKTTLPITNFCIKLKFVQISRNPIRYLVIKDKLSGLKISTYEYTRYWTDKEIEKVYHKLHNIAINNDC